MYESIQILIWCAITIIGVPLLILGFVWVIKKIEEISEE